MRVFALKTCDTCRKALRELRAAGAEPDVIDVRADGVTDADLSAMWSALGEALVNRKSTTWRGLSEGEKAGDPKALLAAHPTLIKRPVITEGSDWTVGWTAEAKAKWLG